VSEFSGLAVHAPPGGAQGNGFNGGPERSLFSSRTVANLRLVWEHRRMLRRAGLSALLASTLIAFLIPKRYEATTQIMPPEGVSGVGMAMLDTLSARGSGESTGGGSLGGLALGGIASDLIGMKSSGALFVGILGSRTVTDRIIEQFQLDRVYHTKKIEDTRIALWHRMAIFEDRRSGIITITVTDQDPRRAAAMAQAYVTELDRLVAQVSTSSARRERIFLEERLRTVKADLDNAARRFSEFASKNAAIDVPAQGRAMVEAAAELQGELMVSESELREFQQIYAPTNIRVRALEARVGELKRQLENLGGSDAQTGANGAGSDGKSAGSLYPSIRKLPLLGVTYFDLYRESKIQETVYELLTRQYELAKVEEAKQIPSVKVLDAAVVPTKKTFPHRLQLMVLGTIVGLALSVLWIFVRRWWNGIALDDPGRQLLEEMGASVWMGARRFAPGVALGRAAARVRRMMPGRRLASPQANETEERAEKLPRAG
jgi:capsule polysaccharide export protein KpsE/RkpR